MSDWQLNQERGIHKTPSMEMPPLPPEPKEVEQQPVQEALQEIAQEVEAIEEQETPVEAAPAKRARADEEANFREMRNEYRRLREENERLQREMQQRSAPQEEVEEDLRSEDIVEGKHLKRVNNKLRVLEQRLEQSNIELRLKTQYPDFDKVVTTDTINELKERHPELYHTIHSSSDLYNKAASAYTLIKKLGVGQPDEYEREKLIAQKNAAKPRTVTSIAPQQGNTPLSQANAFANGLTPELQAQLIKEMNAARRGH